MCTGSDFFLGVLAVLFPPVAVWVKRGICSGDSLINIALCILGFLPGLFHAWYIISLYPDRSYDPLEHGEEGTVRYYYAGSATSAPRPGGSGGYGTLNQQPANQFPGQQQSGVVNQHKPAPAAKYQDHPTPQQQDGQAGSSSGGAAPPPPSYADAVKGDHKVQDRD